MRVLSNNERNVAIETLHEKSLCGNYSNKSDKITVYSNFTQ